MSSNPLDTAVADPTATAEPRGGIFGWYAESDRKVRRVFWTCSAAWRSMRWTPSSISI